MLFSDLPKSMLALHAGQDRAEVLERAWEQSWGSRNSLPDTGPESDGPLNDGLRSSWAQHDDTPLLVLNGTSVHDNCRVSTSVLDADVDASPNQQALTDRRPSTADCQSQSSFERLRPTIPLTRRRTWALPATHDTVDYLNCDPVVGADVRLSTAALLSARFPVVSPSGRLTDCGGGDPIQVVDGGYLDNSGAWTVVDLWRRVRHAVKEHNTGTGTCIVPVFLQIDNEYAVEDRAPHRRPPVESLVPLSVFTHIRQGNENNARQQAALIFDAPTFGAVARAEVSGVTVRRYAHVYPGAQPGTKAPLGWLLSDSAMNGLDKQLENNERALRTVRSWFDADLRCDR